MYYYVVVVDDVIGLNNSVFTQKQLDRLLATFLFSLKLTEEFHAAFVPDHFILDFVMDFALAYPGDARGYVCPIKLP